jgi:uncharacterized membrane protein YoaK (UPF0700 family)
LDAVGFLRLGGVFTSVMTANMVLLGISAGRHNAPLALHAGAAFTGYILGLFIGSRVAGRAVDGQPTWPRRVTVALGVEFALIVSFAAWWEVTGGHPSSGPTYGFLGLNAAALGIQSSAVLRFGVPGVSTTYLTGLLTQLVADMRGGARQFPGRGLTILLALISGGALGAGLAIDAPRLMPIVPLGALILVVAGSLVALGE